MILLQQILEIHRKCSRQRGIFFIQAIPGLLLQKNEPEASDSQERDLAPVSLIAAVPNTQDRPRWNDELNHQSLGKMFTYQEREGSLMVISRNLFQMKNQTPG